MRKKASILSLVIFMYLLFGGLPAFAQTAPAPAEISAKTSFPDEDYQQPTFQNLSKSYWALAMFDLSDNDAIDGYLMINQCELFKKFFRSDFEIEGLREATRQSIQKNLAFFPLKYEVMIPMGLDRYNTGTEKFTIVPKYQYLGAKRLEIAENDSNEDICNGAKQIAKYPKNFVLSLNRPFILTEVPVKPEVAQFYMDRTEEGLPGRQEDLDVSKLGRVAFLRLKISLSQFRGYTYPLSGVNIPYADIFGTIDEYEVYADRDKALLLYSGKNYRQGQGNKSPGEGINIPVAGPLIESAPDTGPEKAVINSGGSGTDASADTGVVESHFDLPPAATFSSGTKPATQTGHAAAAPVQPPPGTK
jgi:hypothetical protein